MKKAIAILLSLMLVLSLAACGGQTEEPAESINQTTTPETTAPVQQETVEQTEAPTQETEAPTEAQPAFDTGWAGAEYEMPVPQVPFAAFDVSFSDGQNLYIITDTSDSSERVDHAALAAYCDTLKAVGYTEIEKEMLSADEFQAELDSIGASTLFSASNAAGYRVLVYQEESTPMIWVYCPGA